MNLNEYGEELKEEEQRVLDELIKDMDSVLESLDDNMKSLVKEAKDSNISINPDLYLSKILAEKGLKDTKENRKKILQAKDELYHTRLLLEYESDGMQGVQELKVGLHSCIHGKDQFIIDWKMPICRHYLMDNTSTEFESIVKGKHNEEYRTKYKLLVKNQVTLRFTRVVKALNLYPGVFDDNGLEFLKGKNILSDEFLEKLISRFNPDDYDPDSAAQIIVDEFLQELAERRSTPEFKNIVFSIQKKQAEIIQSPYKQNIIVQGCAGSGKSMIMLHRLPIILYDNPNSLIRAKLYIITPSQMYIQLAENMRHQLEISDINMGTIEQYYDYCISKYAGHKAGEYGKIKHNIVFSKENEDYIYSSQCVDDICDYLNTLGQEKVSLEKAFSILPVKDNRLYQFDTPMQRVNNRLLVLQNILNANNDVIVKYFKSIMSVMELLEELDVILRHRKNSIVREIVKRVNEEKKIIDETRKEISKLDPEVNSLAIQNRENLINSLITRIKKLVDEKNKVDDDEIYFQQLNDLATKVADVAKICSGLESEFSKNTVGGIYDALSNRDKFVSEIYDVLFEISNIDEKYTEFVSAISVTIRKTEKAVGVLEFINDSYLDLNYYAKIRNEKNELSANSENVIEDVHKLILSKIGIEPSDNRKVIAVKYSPYIWLQTIYCYKGSMQQKESLLAIDEAQGIAPEELRLINNINGKNVVFNMYGDVYQHIEGTKGIDSWDEFKNIIDFVLYEMNENYRNACQITEHCNKEFGMNMIAINTPGKGVHVYDEFSNFSTEFINQLLDTQRAGLAAILVGNSHEAEWLLDEFSRYEQKLNDMTDEENTIHRTRWNIINIDDAKGLEFSSVIVLSSRMSRNEKYIAYTRALDDLYIYSGIIDITEYENKKKNNKSKNENDSSEKDVSPSDGVHHGEKSKKNYTNSYVRKYFEEAGLEVIDNREETGKLWVIGERDKIKNIIDAAIDKFGISGKYASSGKETNNRNGWYTKTDK